jgi:hypothetical protein
MNRKNILEAAPDGSNCVTTVSNSLSGQPAAIISQFLEDEKGKWQAKGAPVCLPIDQIPELIEMLEGVMATVATK